MCAGYAVALQDPPQEYRFGEGLVGQAAMSKQSIVVTELPLGYLDVRSGPVPPRSARSSCSPSCSRASRWG